ncbi:MAG: hypothetical protein Q7T44_06970 [Parvibaculum sp.]|nr:hypothetical protein [Parvibaculum sp.]
MKPEVTTVMHGYVGTLFGSILPNLNSEYSMGDTGLMAMSFMMMAQEFDRAAEIRLQENEDMRALFAHAAEEIDNEPLAKRLREAASGADASLRVSALTKANDELKALLIELHEYVEASSAKWAPELEMRIWSVLCAGVERRKLDFPKLF